MEAFHGGSRRDRERTLTQVHRRGGVCMTSYGMLVNNAHQLAMQNGREYVWVSKHEQISMRVANCLHKEQITDSAVFY